MPAKGMRSVFFHSSPPRRSATPPPSLAAETLRATLMENNITTSEQLINKWNPNGSSSSSISSLFYENREEAHRFLLATHDLHEAMCFFSSNTLNSSNHHQLLRGHRLLEIAMARLNREFYQILAANRDPDSVHSVTTAETLSSSSELDYPSDAESIRETGVNLDRAVMIDLRDIAQCMVSCGHTRECVATYTSLRRSLVGENLFHLGFDSLSPKKLKKLDWTSLKRRIVDWIAASDMAIQSLFSRERALCDFLFGDGIGDSCFAKVTRDAAVKFLGFPELAALNVNAKRFSPEKTFYFLDMYSTIAELLPDIEEIFSSTSTSNVRSQVEFTLAELGEYVRVSLLQFERSLRKDTTKETVPGGGILQLTRRTMDYVVTLADYEASLVEIYKTCTIPSPVPSDVLVYPSSPRSTIGEDELEVSPNVFSQMAWLLLALLCKLNSTAELYKDPSLAYLFLANNLHYVLSRVRRSSNLSRLLGREWEVEHEGKARSFARSYERFAWKSVLDSIPSDPAALIGEVDEDGVPVATHFMKRFNGEFEAAYWKQADWGVMDAKTRKELRASILRKVVEPYEAFYDVFRSALMADSDSIGVIRFAPADVEAYLSRLFDDGNGSWGSASPSGSSSPSGSASASPLASTGKAWKGSQWRSFLRLTRSQIKAVLRLRG